MGSLIYPMSVKASFLCSCESDITAFTNVAYSNQGGSQMNMEWGAVIFRGLNMTTNPYSKSVNKNSLGIFKVAFNCFHGRGIEMAQHP